MRGQKKLIGEERRSRILQILKETDTPITGSELAAKTNVSRQAIVGDITLLKARKEPIISTNQGYLYMQHGDEGPCFEKIITCHLSPESIENVINLIVDHGITIKDIQIKHPVFGSITATIMISNRSTAKLFIKELSKIKAFFLSEISFGNPLITLSSTSEEVLTEVEKELKKTGFLMDSEKESRMKVEPRK
jgi:uncharacterized protein